MPEIPQSVRIEIGGIRPLALTKQQLIELFGAWPKVVDRMLAASRNGEPWLEIISNRDGIPGSETRVTTASAEKAFERIRAGDVPPLLPSEQNPKGRVRSKNQRFQKTEPWMDDILKVTRQLPQAVHSITFTRESRSIMIQLEDGSIQFCRLARPRPGKPRQLFSITFQSSPDAPSPLNGLSSGEIE